MSIESRVIRFMEKQDVFTEDPVLSDGGDPPFPRGGHRSASRRDYVDSVVFVEGSREGAHPGTVVGAQPDIGVLEGEIEQNPQELGEFVFGKPFSRIKKKLTPGISVSDGQGKGKMGLFPLNRNHPFLELVSRVFRHAQARHIGNEEGGSLRYGFSGIKAIDCGDALVGEVEPSGEGEDTRLFLHNERKELKGGIIGIARGGPVKEVDIPFELEEEDILPIQSANLGVLPPDGHSPSAKKKEQKKEEKCRAASLKFGFSTCHRRNIQEQL